MNELVESWLLSSGIAKVRVEQLLAGYAMRWWREAHMEKVVFPPTSKVPHPSWPSNALLDTTNINEWFYWLAQPSMVLPPLKNKILYFDQISKSSKKYAEKGRKNSNLANSDSVFKHFFVFGWFKVKIFGPKAQNFITQGKYESFMTAIIRLVKAGNFLETWLLQCIVCCPLFLHENNSCRPNLARLGFFSLAAAAAAQNSPRPLLLSCLGLTRNSIIMSRLTLQASSFILPMNS